MTPNAAIKRVGGYHPASALRHAIGQRKTAINFRERPDLRALRILARAVKRGSFYHDNGDIET